MVEISKNELINLESMLCDFENIMQGDMDLDGLETFYSDCLENPKRLRKILDMLEIKFNEIHDLWQVLYDKIEER